MDLRPNNTSSVLAEGVPVNRSRFTVSPNLLAYSPPSSAFSPTLHLSVPRKKTIPGKLDDVRAGGLLDSMTASSPPAIKLRHDPSDDTIDKSDTAYRKWLLKYPSAISCFEQIATNAKGKKIVLFLDYDGTLSPIVNNPDCAFMSNAMRSAVKHASEYFPTAIISGRSRDKVYEFVGLKELHYAGSHGLDIMGPARQHLVDDHQNCIRITNKEGKEVNIFQPASKFIPMIEEVFKILVENTKGIKGATIENNKFCCSVHYRLVDEKNWCVIAQIVLDILKGYPDLKLTHGRKVLEIRPVINWNKGKAVEFLIESLGLSNSDDVLPIYVGDDRTDEDAFKVLRKDKRGYGILVSSVPKESSAFYSLRDPSEVMYFLQFLVRWKNSTALGC